MGVYYYFYCNTNNVQFWDTILDTFDFGYEILNVVSGIKSRMLL